MWDNRVKCNNCIFYSINNCFCNLRNRQISPNGNCVDFRSEDSMQNIKGKRCSKCTYYSVNNCFCNLRNRQISPDGNCVDFYSK